MLRTLLALTLAMICCAVASAQQPNPQCPMILIKGPWQLPRPGEPIPFSVNVKPSESKLTYKWSLSHGDVASGQGTRNIGVKVAPNEGIPTVTLEVEGLPQECPHTFTETTIIDVPPQPTRIDTFALPLSAIADERFRAIGDAIERNPTAQIFILMPGNKPIRYALFDRLKTANSSQVDPTHITVVDTDYSSALIEIWLVPPGATPPSKCDACQKLETGKRDCPKITVTGPPDIIAPGETMTFMATVENGGGSSLKYNWTIEGGTIQRGQGTSTLVVTFKPSEKWQPKAIATIEVIGLPAACRAPPRRFTHM